MIFSSQLCSITDKMPFNFTGLDGTRLLPASPCLQAAQFQPGPPPPVESPWPLYGEEQTLGNVCRNIHPVLVCTCCS